MPGPLVVFSFVLATLVGAIFHLIWGGEARRMALFLLMGWVGFALGQLAGQSLGIDLFAIGELRVLSALIGAFFADFVTAILTGQRTTTRRASR